MEEGKNQSNLMETSNGNTVVSKLASAIDVKPITNLEDTVETPNLRNLPQALQYATFNPEGIVKSESYERGKKIEEYVQSLKGLRKETLQEIQRRLPFFDVDYSDEQLRSYFKEQWNVSVEGKKDLEYLSFAVSEKLEKVWKNKESKKKREERGSLLWEGMSNGAYSLLLGGGATVLEILAYCGLREGDVKQTLICGLTGLLSLGLSYFTTKESIQSFRNYFNKNPLNRISDSS